jgi:signal peptidase I
MNENNKENTKHYSFFDGLRTLIFAFCLAILFRSLAYEPFHIPTGSMKNTLLVGDYLFVSKYAYGYSRYSFPLGLPFFSGRVMDMNQPKRGDIVVFRVPLKPHVDFIKRIIGMPGDRIQLKEGMVYINGEELKRQRITDYADDENKKNIRSIPTYSETLPEGKVITILKQYKIGPADDTPIYTVPEGHYFMMGDNRDNSHDSRYLEDLGFIPEENIVGRAEILFFSTDGTFRLKDPVSWFTSMRTERFFKRLE